jgi:uncharacterized membrane protein
MRVAANCGVRIVALLGIVVQATTFVARLATIRILPATRFTKDLIRGSLVITIDQKLLCKFREASSMIKIKFKKLGDAAIKPQ